MSTPAELGLPAKFSSFRKGQEDCALELVADELRFSSLSAPTGTGKSLIYMAMSKIMGVRTLILTGTKGLQGQLLGDFTESGLVDMRGQSNYRCIALDEHLINYGRPGSGCNEGPCHVGIFCNLRDDGDCLYYSAQDRAKEADIVVTNYAYWLTLGRHSNPDILGKFDLLIMDEAHGAPEWLSNFCAVSLDSNEIQSLLGLKLPPLDEGVEIWSSWARDAQRVAGDAYQETKAQLESSKQSATKRMLRLMELQRDLRELGNASHWKQSETPKKDARMPGLHTDWVAENTKRGIKFSPVWAHAYAEPYLFRGIPRIILSSATMTSATCRYLGIPGTKYRNYEAGGGFDPKRRPFTYLPTVRVDRKMVEGEVRMWINKIDRIIGSRLDRKGIIHTRSYARANEIKERSKYGHLMLTHSWKDMASVVERFRDSEQSFILVSPSLEEGFDFPYDSCRYQIIAKVPFVDNRNPLVKARAASDKSYLNHITALSITQMIGRGMRAADDWCESFIVDDHWSWFSRAAIKEFPQWFKKAWKRSSGIPEPMSLTD